MKYSLLFTCSIILLSCTAQKTQLLIRKIDTTVSNRFDIDKFNNRKDESNMVNYEDNIIKIFQFYYKSDSTYNEYITYKKKYITTIKYFYNTGKIKGKGFLYYPGSAEIGVWQYFDRDDQLIKTEDLDKLHKISYKDALRIASKYYGYRQKDIRVNYYIAENVGVWMLEKMEEKRKWYRSYIMIDPDTGEHKEYKLSQPRY